MTINEIRESYLAFCRKNGHTIVPSAALVPDNDPTTLFTGSGMQPMLPFLLGETHPLGTRIADSQKSFRTTDIEDVGDNRHTTFFEMLGNWSFGDYFQEQQLEWIFSFLTEEVKLDPRRIYVTAYSGDKNFGLEQDRKAVEIWKKLFKEKGIDAYEVVMGSEEQASEIGMNGERIFLYNDKNWWSRAGIPQKMPIGEPGGPDAEMFYEFPDVEHNPKYGKYCHPNCDCGRFIEIGNNVFMQFVKVSDKSFELLPKKNIDFGGGLERLAMAVQDINDIILLDVFKETISKLESLSGKKYSDETYVVAFRIIADHVRASAFLIGDGVLPGNTDQGYFVRRLLRRAVRYWDKLGITDAGISELVEPMISYYKNAYPETFAQLSHIKEEIRKEEEKFRKTLASGLKEFEKLIHAGSPQISGKEAFDLYQSYGFPLEITTELARERNVSVDEAGFKDELIKHQDLSRSGAEKKFKGGLGDTSEMSLKYHTATHLLNAALHQVLGDHVGQKGSNITPERLRFDFSHPQKMTDEEKKRVEDIVNDYIKQELPVGFVEMPRAEAEKVAIHAFNEKYGDVVKVYRIGNDGNYISQEFCGGPHVSNTCELGTFKIQKEEAVSQGVRRIKAVLT